MYRLFGLNHASVVYNSGMWAKLWDAILSPQWQIVITFLIFAAATVGIWQTRNIQRRYHAHALLSEIMQWATDVDKIAVSRPYKEVKDDVLKRTKSDYQHLKAKGAYIAELAKSSFANISLSVSDVIKKLEDAIQAYETYLNTHSGDKGPVIPADQALGESTEKLIKQIGKTRAGMRKPFI
ncbi:MAG: hypothetical protein AB1597_03915 [Chloroflexota bacterium]